MAAGWAVQRHSRNSLPIRANAMIRDTLGLIDQKLRAVGEGSDWTPMERPAREDDEFDDQPVKMADQLPLHMKWTEEEIESLPF